MGLVGKLTSLPERDQNSVINELKEKLETYQGRIRDLEERVQSKESENDDLRTRISQTENNSALANPRGAPSTLRTEDSVASLTKENEQLRRTKQRLEKMVKESVSQNDPTTTEFLML